MQPGQQAIEGDKAGLALEDALEAGAELGCSRFLGIALVGFEIGVEPPDQLTDEVDGPSLRIVEADELVDQALSMNSAQAVLADAELAGAVGDDDRIVEEAMAMDAAPKGALGRDLD